MMMRRTLFTTAVAMGSMLFVISSCSTMKKLEKEVIETAVKGQIVPEQLEAVNDQINFDYLLNFGEKEFPKKMILKIAPRMQYGSRSERLDPIMLQGTKVKDTDYPVVEWKGITEYVEKMQIPYQDGMENGVLYADIEAMDRKGNKVVELSPVVLNDNGVRVWEQHSFTYDGVTYIPVGSNEFMVDGVMVKELGVLSSYIMFPLASSKITSDQMNSPEMMKAQENLKEMMSYKGLEFKHANIYASSSPEGPERLNQNLTMNRYKAAKSAMSKMMDKEKCPAAKCKDFCSHTLINENWDGLYVLLNKSNLPNKMQMVADMKAAKDNAAREELLKGYMKEYPELQENILPQLRRADFFVFFTVPAEIAEQVKATYYMPQDMSFDPAIYQDWQMLNNLATVAMHNGEYHKARKLLESAAAIEQDDQVMNNLAVAYAQTGDLDKAINVLSNRELKDEAKYNLGLMLLQKGDYKKAAHYLKAMPDANLAYAQMMGGDTDAALETFQAIDLTNGEQYYAMAVTAARAENPTLMVTALAKAIQMKPELKKWAATDVEFYPYKDNAGYLNVIK